MIGQNFFNGATDTVLLSIVVCMQDVDSAKRKRKTVSWL